MADEQQHETPQPLSPDELRKWREHVEWIGHWKWLGKTLGAICLFVATLVSGGAAIKVAFAFLREVTK